MAGPAILFRSLYRRAPGRVSAKANVSDLRTGYLQMDEQGIVLDGQAVPRQEIRMLVMLPLLLVGVLFAAIAGTLMEYAFRHPERFGVRWDSVREICLSPTNQEASLVYDGFNHAGQVKTYSLAMRLGAEYYPLFAQSAQQFAGVRVTEGRLRNATPLAVWIILSVFLAIIVGVIIMAAVSPSH